MSQDGSVSFVWEVLCLLWKNLFGTRVQWSSDTSLEGKTVVITGCNTGIGKATALDLARRGARVIGGCRDIKKAEEAAEDIRQSVPNAQIVMKPLDLASLASVRRFATDVLSSEPHIHILINNAGVMGCPKSQTEDGFELHLGINYLGHFLLTLLVLSRLKESRPARIVNLTSVVYNRGQIDFGDINMDLSYSPLSAYCRSKLAIVLFTRELAKRLEGTGVTVYSLHPGVVQTEIFRGAIAESNRFLQALAWKVNSIQLFFLKTPQQGSRTTIYCAIESSLANESGFYYEDCRKVDYSPVALDDDLARKMWKLSEKLTDTSCNIIQSENYSEVDSHKEI